MLYFPQVSLGKSKLSLSFIFSSNKIIQIIKQSKYYTFAYPA